MGDAMDERYEELEAAISELSDKVNELIDKIEELDDGIEDKVEDAVSSITSDLESAVEDAAECAINDAMSDLNVGSQQPLLIVFSQDKKHIVPVFSFETRRIKKGEEPYAIYAHLTPSGNTCVIGRYPNKEAALAEMQKIAKAIWNGPKFYEIK